MISSIKIVYEWLLILIICHGFSGLPTAVRTDVHEMFGSESDSDGDSSLEASGSQCHSMAQVHASSPGNKSNHSRGSYGATATVVNETRPAASPVESGSVRSKNSFHSVEEEDTDVEILDDHFTADNEMRGLISGGETGDEQEVHGQLQIDFLGMNHQSPSRRPHDDDDEYYDDPDEAEEA